jgi:hypothetical protein
MKKWGKSLIIILLFLVSGCSVSVHPMNNIISKDWLTSNIPIAKDVKSLKVWSTELPGAKRMTFINPNDKSIINQVIVWLNNSKEVGVEKPSPGKDGYPPGLSIITTKGFTLSIRPAVNWTKKVYPDHTVIIGKNAEGYVAIIPSNNSQMVRIYSPKLYNWIEKNEWNSIH